MQRFGCFRFAGVPKQTPYPYQNPSRNLGRLENVAGFKGWMKDERCASRTASCQLLLCSLIPLDSSTPGFREEQRGTGRDEAGLGKLFQISPCTAGKSQASSPLSQPEQPKGATLAATLVQSIPGAGLLHTAPIFSSWRQGRAPPRGLLQLPLTLLAMQRASHGPRAKNVGGASLLGASFGMQIGLITCSPPVDAGILTPTPGTPLGNDQLNALGLQICLWDL